VSARVRRLIDSRDAGNRASAAARLGVKPELLDGLMSGDWRQFSLDALVAVIRTHDVSIDWLLGCTVAGRQTTQGNPSMAASTIKSEGVS
jgi:predicted XRE-type DNA-binding protein